MEAYVAGRPPGDFLRAVANADDENRCDLVEIVQHVYSNLPGACWGSKEKVQGWLSRHGRAFPFLESGQIQSYEHLPKLQVDPIPRKEEKP